MKGVMMLAVLGLLGAVASAQQNPVQPAPAVAPAEQKVTMHDLQKKHGAAVAELQKNQAAEIKALKESLKGKPQAEIKKALGDKKAEHQNAMKALRDSNRAEMAQYKKDHPAPMKHHGRKAEPKAEAKPATP